MTAAAAAAAAAAKKQKRYELTEDKFLSEAERDLLIKHLTRYIKGNERDTALIFLAIFTGGRAREILNVKKADLSLPNYVQLYGVKNSRNRKIPIPDWLFKQLIKLPQDPTSGRLFNISYQRLDKIWKKWRTTKKKFHSLRHTFAVRTFTRTKDFKLIQSALGHRSHANTHIYLDFVYNDEQMKRLLE